MKCCLAMCAIVKNELPYILEWLAHYRLLGVERFLIFDNGSTDGTFDFLNQQQGLGHVEVRSWPSIEGLSPQLTAYQQGLKDLSSVSEFVGFFDVDEFLIPYSGADLIDYLSSLPVSVGALAINQRVIGSNGHEKYSSELVLKRFQRGSSIDYEENFFFKTICRSDLVGHIDSAHSVKLESGSYIHASGELVVTAGHLGKSSFIDSSHFMLHHFILKSKEEFSVKRLRGGVSSSLESLRAKRYTEDFFHNREMACNSSLLEEQSLFASKVEALVARIS